MKTRNNFGIKTDFKRNIAMKPNLGSLFNEDIKLSKKSLSKTKHKKLAIIDDINDEEKKIDGFYDRFLKVLYNDEIEKGRGSFSNHKKHKKMHFHKRISAGILDFTQKKFQETTMNKNYSPDKNIIKKNFHHMGTTFEPKLEEEKNNNENNEKSNKSIKLYDDDKSEEINIENLKSLDCSKRKIKITELMKNDNIDYEINLNSNREQTTKNDNNKDFLENKLNSNFIIFNDNKLDDDKKENKNECNSNKDKGFIIDVKKKKKFFFCCLPIFN